MGRSRSNVIGQRFRTGARRGFDGLKVYSSQAFPLVVVLRVLVSTETGEEREYDYAEKYAHNENGEKQVSFGGHSAKHSKSSLYCNEGREPGGGPRPHTSDLKAQAAARQFVKRAEASWFLRLWSFWPLSLSKAGRVMLRRTLPVK